MTQNNQFNIGLQTKESLSEWLTSFCQSSKYLSLIERFKQQEGSITNSEETAALFGAIQYLRPQLSLEIGTFFGNTARIMAEAIFEAGIDGRLVTIDPFGEERVPAILESWPKELQRIVEFKPWSSMQYFLELETLNLPKGKESQLSVSFVDGHHNLEYALFDIVRSADHLKPGGIIFVDNIEQAGPKAAARQFLSWNPAWKLFFKKNILLHNSLDVSSSDHTWCALIAPNGIQIANAPYKLMKRTGVVETSIKGFSLNLAEVSDPGTLFINLAYFSVPYDYHITGLGMIHTTYQGTKFVSNHESKITIEFPSPLTVDLTRSDINVRYELELTYSSDINKQAYVLLDAQHPLELIPNC